LIEIIRLQASEHRVIANGNFALAEVFSFGLDHGDDVQKQLLLAGIEFVTRLGKLILLPHQGFPRWLNLKDQLSGCRRISHENNSLQ
jgi:hypothetical protein